MNAILELLHNNEPLAVQLRAATSKDNATSIIIEAAKQRGQSFDVSDVSEFFAQRPKTNPEALSEEELEAVSGGLMRCSVVLSDFCCYTCRTSQVSW